MAKAGDYKIPFTPGGDQLHYPDPWTKAEFRDNHEFEDRLIFQGFSRGRSAAYAEFLRQDGRRVTMFLRDLEDAMPRMAGGHITGTFTFTKRGQNYGCRVLPLA